MGERIRICIYGFFFSVGSIAYMSAVSYIVYLLNVTIIRKEMKPENLYISLLPRFLGFLLLANLSAVRH